MKFFVELGIDPLFKDNINQTVLYYACREGKFECVKYLVEMGTFLTKYSTISECPSFIA